MKVAVRVLFACTCTCAIAITAFGQAPTPQPQQPPLQSPELQRQIDEFARQTKEQRAAIRQLSNTLHTEQQFAETQKAALQTQTELVDKQSTIITQQEQAQRQRDLERTAQEQQFQRIVDVATFLALTVAILCFSIVIMRWWKKNQPSPNDRMPPRGSSMAKIVPSDRPEPPASGTSPDDTREPPADVLKKMMRDQGVCEMERTLTLLPQNLQFRIVVMMPMDNIEQLTVRFKNDPARKIMGWEKRRSYAAVHPELATNTGAKSAALLTAS